MQRAAYTHYCRLGDSFQEIFAFYCDGCGVKRAGVSERTVARHKTKNNCATKTKHHVSTRIMDTVVFRVTSSSCLMIPPLLQCTTQSNADMAPPQLRVLWEGAEKALRYVNV